MGSGWFEILFILLILLAPVFEAWKKQRRQGGAEAPPDELEGPGASRRRHEGPARAERPGRAATGRTRPSGAAPDARSGGGEGRERGAEELLPEDLWKILTGQAPPGAPPPSPRRTPDDRPGHEPAPVSRERDRPSFGAGAEDGRDREPVSAEAAPPVEPGRAPGTDLEEYRSATVEPADSEPGGADLGGLMSGRSRTDLGGGARSGEIGSGDFLGGSTGEEEVVPSGAGPARELRRRASTPVFRDDGTRTHHFFRDLDRKELRRAIVLNEVLGPPLTLREGERR